MENERTERPARPRKRRKVCVFCADKIYDIDYKDVSRLRRFMIPSRGRTAAGRPSAPVSWKFTARCGSRRFPVRFPRSGRH